MNRTGRPTSQSFIGVVATPHSLASAAGLRVWQDGGSAIDAAIAAELLPGRRAPAHGVAAPLAGPRRVAGGDRRRRPRRLLLRPDRRGDPTASARLGGTFTAGSPAAHRAEWVEPIAATYRDMTALAFPPNSRGITALVELNLAEFAGEQAPWGTVHHPHPLIEAKKLAFAVQDQ